jgi:23S rRNA pseudoU1915 N3-methylase RlmH
VSREKKQGQVQFQTNLAASAQLNLVRSWCELVFVEQLDRATTILAGHP